ncbi:GerMN domain-containing protein [Iamia majanohamensis]|uniref:GerMN domain-containing protein n=1 Tax=Iamia majanohamensis TaxID=467976 RepID=A0AAE9Y3E6_9ACTN|nr:GerMN domain-containing protein [Iamia majanohamensis]WCO65254.1 GerMN domain-containing protein [Iamia majanohamensis]
MISPLPLRRGAVAALLALLVALLAGGCGVPTDDEPRAITAESTTTQPPPDSSRPTGNTTTIYLSTPSDSPTEEVTPLVAVTRNLDAPPTPSETLATLFDGPTEEEQQRGLVSLIPPDTGLEEIELDSGGRLTLDLTMEWSLLQGPDELVAYAQVVLTATDLPEVNSVRFQVEGEPIAEVPTDDEPKTQVTGDDYRELDPSV